MRDVVCSAFATCFGVTALPSDSGAGMGDAASAGCYSYEVEKLRILAGVLTVSALSLGVMAACSSFSGEPAADAADAAGEAATSGGDAAAGDASTTYCSGQRDAAFCEDFDTVADVALLELEKGGQADGRLTRETFVSPPRALAFNLVEGATSGFVVYKRAMQTERPMRLSFDFRVGTFVGTEGQNMQLMTLRRDGSQLTIQRICGTGDAGALECTWSLVVGILDADAGPKFEFIPIGTRLAAEDAWSRVTMEVAFSATTGYVALTQNGKTLRRELPTARPGAALTGPTSATVGIGILQGQAGATELLVDNVLVETL